MERKLVSIRTITELKPIPDADKIECAMIDGGWPVVVSKGTFTVGDPCVFFEIDSFLPVRPEYEFLRKSCYRSYPGHWEGFRIKTMKLRGQLSQGLALPVDEIFPDSDVPDAGVDITSYHGVLKWDDLPHKTKAIPAQAKGPFPSFIPKTDQERAQNCLRELQATMQSSTLFEVTLKLDGTSMTVYRNGDDFGVCSRNLDLLEGCTHWDVANELQLRDKLPDGYAFQGELMGPGIQGNRENLPKHKWFVFDIWDIKNTCYVPPAPRWHFAQSLGLDHVPIVLHAAQPLKSSLDELLRQSEIPSLNHPMAEGLVFKSHDGQRSFKVISNKFLLAEKD